MSLHTIIYLDQNYLSNMAKAKIGVMRNAEQAAFWRSLLDDLKKAVLANKIACPESDFHGIESMFDRRIEKQIMEVVDELSWGLEFNSWQSILTSQIEEAAFMYLNKQPQEKEAWSLAFKSDPLSPVEGRMQNINGVMSRINVRLFLPSEVADHDRQNKLVFYDEAQKLAKQFSKKPLNWSELVLQSKRSTMDGFLGGMARQNIDKLLAEGSPTSINAALNKCMELRELFGGLQAIGIDTTSPKVMDFLESEQLLNIPFADIFSSIWAVIAEYYIQVREVKQGDFYDAPLLSLAIPYCNIVTTDRFMKEILTNRLQFNQKFDTLILSASEADKSELKRIIRGLISN